nr:hypothetical protein [Cytophagales bacterium]
MPKSKADPILIAADGPVTKADLEAALDLLGISSGDILMIHSRLFSLGRIPTGASKEKFADIFINTLLNRVGAKGTLLFPTFTLSTCKSGIFDVDKTPSEMGMLSERARSRPDSTRTYHPIYSVALMGKLIESVVEAKITSCFGEGAIFDVLHSLNYSGTSKGKVKFLTIGIDTPPEAVTYIHSIEEKMKVPYRYHKTFPCIIHANGIDSTVDVEFYVRYLNENNIFDKHACWDLLKGQKGIFTTKFGDSSLTALNEKAVFEAVKKAIEEDINFLCFKGMPK